MKGLARLFVATAAGAGMGAAAALARRHLFGADGSDGRTWTPAAAVDHAPPSAAAAPAPHAPTSAASAPALDIADLEAARVRLRRRAAELRAEMEGRTQVQ